MTHHKAMKWLNERCWSVVLDCWGQRAKGKVGEVKYGKQLVAVALFRDGAGRLAPGVSGCCCCYRYRKWSCQYGLSSRRAISGVGGKGTEV